MISHNSSSATTSFRLTALSIAAAAAILTSCNSRDRVESLPEEQPAPVPAPTPEPVPAPARAQLAEEDPALVTRTDLVALLEEGDLAPVGITITPDTGELFLLDAAFGVFAMDDDRTFYNVASADDLYAQLREQIGITDPAAAVPAFTDIAAIGSGQFAVTARNDGFLLDLADGSLRQHFCYVPGSFIPNPQPVEQLTESAAFDPITARIIIQPVSIMSGTIFVDSEVGTFPLSGGIGEDWHPLWRDETILPEPSLYLASAMAIDPTGGIWLADGPHIRHYEMDDGRLSHGASLETLDITSVTGMTSSDSGLYILDGGSLDIVHIPAAELAQLGMTGWAE